MSIRNLLASFCFGAALALFTFVLASYSYAGGCDGGGGGGPPPANCNGECNENADGSCAVGYTASPCYNEQNCWCDEQQLNPPQNGRSADCFCTEGA